MMDMVTWLQAGLIAWLLTATGIRALEREEEGLQQYCNFETFNASCPEKHVILMTSAEYGRMRTGRCVTQDFGYLGCKTNVLPIFNQRCTGRRSCDLSIPDPALTKTNPCPKDVSWHVEAAYKCVPVLSPDESARCRSHQPPALVTSSRYISSRRLIGGGVGSHGCPYQVRVKEGQTISLSVYNTFVSGKAPGSDVCYTLGVVTEQHRGSDIIVCPEEFHESKYVTKYTSKGSSIDLSMNQQTTTQQTPSVIRIDVIGCSELEVPPDARLTRSGDEILVTCVEAREETYRLVCRDNKWQGSLGNCSSDANNPWAMEHIFQDGNILPMGILIAVALGVALGIFIGGLLLAIVGSRMKRRQRQRSAQQATLVEPPEYDVSVEVPQRYHHKSPGGGTLSSSGCLEYTLSRSPDYPHALLTGTDGTGGDKVYSSRLVQQHSGVPQQREKDEQSWRCTNAPFHAYETPSFS